MKVARTVLRGRGGGNAAPLPDHPTGFASLRSARLRVKRRPLGNLLEENR